MLTTSFEFNEQNSFLLTCPVRSRADLDFLESLPSKGHPIDIFEENIADSNGNNNGLGTMVKLLTTLEGSELLLSRAGCFEEKGHSAVRRLFAQDAVSMAQIGPEFHSDYRSYQNIKDQLEYYSSTYPDLVKGLKVIGHSHGGRELLVIHLTSAKTEKKIKPLVWVMAGQHAREWISIASTFVFIEKLMDEPQILDQFEFAIMPLVNPDGYEYSRTRNRMWRKNRRAGGGGVDLNRNWDHLWCEIGKKMKVLFYFIFNIFIYPVGGSRLPSRDDYCGTEPASEPEINSTQQYILSLQNRIIGFDVHSYGQLILRNYGWTNNPSPDERILANLSDQMTANIFKKTGLQYTAKLSAGLYPVSGSAEDWMYVKAGIPGFVMEMRDKGFYGFNIPRAQIGQAGVELHAAIITAVSNYKNNKKQLQ